MAAGLFSLTAAYTDSEDEEAGPSREEPSEAEPNKVQNDSESREDTPVSVRLYRAKLSERRRLTPDLQNVGRGASLVSYIDPDEEDQVRNWDDDGGHNREDNTNSVPMDLESSENEDNPVAGEDHVWTDGIKLPPEPSGQCSKKLQENINRLWKLKKEKNFDMNASIQNRKAFRNPSIYEKLIQYCDIDEHGTNFPKELYDGHLFGKESYFDELAKELDSMERARVHAAKIMKSSSDPALAATVKMMNMGLLKK